jgi:hypothetical protein
MEEEALQPGKPRVFSLAVRKLGAKPEDTRFVTEGGLNEAYARDRAVRNGLVDPHTEVIVAITEVGGDDAIIVRAD